MSGEKCQCGCGRDAAYIVAGTDFNGKPFCEGACVSAANYLADASLDMGFAFEAAPIEPTSRLRTIKVKGWRDER